MGIDLRRGIALYIHIPFCRTKCPYCDFNTYAGILRLLPQYLGALGQELRLWGEVLGYPQVNTIFLGGGTPSLLTVEQLGKLLQGVRDAFHVVDGAEVTAEANPDDVTQRRLEGFRRVGVNRLSLGVQSLDDSLLRLLGRRHSAGQAVAAYERARDTGLENINLDLMYGLLCQTLGQWQATLRQVVALGPEHISAYCLTLEEGTPMEQWVREGKHPEPDPDLAAEMYLRAEEELAGAGYRHYEISNWARPGFESRHNLTYWANQPYLGVGPGAHSYVGGRRFFNVASPTAYIQRVRQWVDRGPMLRRDTRDLETARPVEGVELVSPSLEMGETMMLGLRLDRGVSSLEFRRRFGLELAQVYGAVIQELLSVGLLEWADGWVRLTQRGRLLGNEVFSRFLERVASVASPK